MRALCVFGSIALYIACAFVPPSQANFHAFAAMAKDLSALDSAAVVSRVTGALEQANTRAVIDSLIPDPQTVLETVADTLISSGGQTEYLSGLAIAEQNPALRLQFERIQWAASRQDPRLCKLLSEFHPVDAHADIPTLGDLLALCLAETTREASRCNQIDPVTAPSLTVACRNDLEIHIQ